MNITIVGLGVIGGSYALSLNHKKYNVLGIDIDKNSIEEAKKSGAINYGAEYLSSESFDIIANTDLLILALYPSSIVAFIDNYKDYFKSELIISDVSGIKGNIMSEVEAKLPQNIDFIFTHPMAGREKRGFNYAKKGIFKGANFIIIPTNRNKESNINVIVKISKELGFDNIEFISKEEHDKIIAFTSQLPHAIAVSLINSDDLNVNTGKYTGDSYKELTRVANINELLWSELFLNNRENLINMIEKFEYELIRIKDSLKSNDEKALKERFIESTKRREQL